jgi:hypothetical protein
VIVTVVKSKRVFIRASNGETEVKAAAVAQPLFDAFLLGTSVVRGSTPVLDPAAEQEGNYESKRMVK